MEIDLDTLSLADLKALSNRVERAIASYEDRRRNEALSELKTVARKMGFSLEELTGAPVPKAKTVSAPKYANPENPSQTWTGRGRKPAWLIELLDQGRSLEDLAI